MRSFKPSFLEASGSLKLPVSENQYSTTTRALVARKVTSNWQKRFWIMNKVDNPRKVLGRGLGALLPGRPPVISIEPRTDDAQTLPVDAIDPNPFQPRRVFHP